MLLLATVYTAHAPDVIENSPNMLGDVFEHL